MQASILGTALTSLFHDDLLEVIMFRQSYLYVNDGQMYVTKL
jgi:hypothetical protein